MTSNELVKLAKKHTDIRIIKAVPANKKNSLPIECRLGKVTSKSYDQEDKELCLDIESIIFFGGNNKQSILFDVGRVINYAYAKKPRVSL